VLPVTVLFALVAALPQHVQEVIGTATAVLFVGRGLHYLIRGRMTGAERLSKRNVRVRAASAVLIGVGVGVAGFLANGGAGAGWGGTTDVVIMAVWLTIFGAIVIYGIKKDRA
jgi:hypothetical protein